MACSSMTKVTRPGHRRPSWPHSVGDDPQATCMFRMDPGWKWLLPWLQCGRCGASTRKQSSSCRAAQLREPLGFGCLIGVPMGPQIIRKYNMEINGVTMAYSISQTSPNHESFCHVWSNLGTRRPLSNKTPVDGQSGSTSAETDADDAAKAHADWQKQQLAETWKILWDFVLVARYGKVQHFGYYWLRLLFGSCCSFVCTD